MHLFSKNLTQACTKLYISIDSSDGSSCILFYTHTYQIFQKS